ncbi:MAG TPA: cupredoxin domain-containing protein [Candidatus Limnocylindria bacterium]|nr:cupredoxin domain-containing protein [Candidatus Limnocylindria bacterium]
MRLAVRVAIPTAIAGLTFIACASTASAPAASAPAASAPAASAPAATEAAKTAAVAIKGFAFGPASLTIAKGTKVTFTNNDTTKHTVTSGANRTKDGTFDQTLESGSETTISFDTPGTYEYFCSFHSSMKGTIVVR